MTIDITTFDPTTNDHLKDGYIIDLANFKGNILNVIQGGVIPYVKAETIQEYRKEKGNDRIAILTYEQGSKLIDDWENKNFIEPPPKQVTHEEYWEALECLPPIHWKRVGGVEVFCCSEFYTGSITRQYAHVKKDGKHYYFTKMVDVAKLSATTMTMEMLEKLTWDAASASEHH